MKNALAFSLALVAVVVCSWQAGVAADFGSRLIFVACAAFIAFALGIGLGERAHGAFSRGLVRMNKLLGEQNRDLCEMNARHLENEARQRLSAENEEGAQRSHAAN